MKSNTVFVLIYPSESISKFVVSLNVKPVILVSPESVIFISPITVPIAVFSIKEILKSIIIGTVSGTSIIVTLISSS